MDASNLSMQDLLSRLNSDRDVYLTTVSQLYDHLGRILSPIQPVGISPPSNGPPSATITAVPASPSLTPSLRSRRIPASSFRGLGGFQRGRTFSEDESSESEDDESFFAHDSLPRECYSAENLRNHLISYQWDAAGQFVLRDLLRTIDHIGPKELLNQNVSADHHGASHTIVDDYEVSTDGAALHSGRAETNKEVTSIWQSLHSINEDATRRQAVGRITILREPSSLLLGMIHLTMNDNFDMDSIFRMLIDDSPTKAYMKECLKGDLRHQRSFVFSFKYHTIIGKDRDPMPWQSSDDDLTSSDDHIPISTCLSVVALSLLGNTSTTLSRNSRRKKSIVGHVFDPFAPWKVLSIQCFPDWQSNVETHETNHHYVNGPEAFLVTLLAEYRDASKRFLDLNKRIVKLITPSKRFLFDRSLRDELLFESIDFKYSRRYFWAFQALALLDDEIEGMISQYRDTFTDEVWSGEHKYIWPGTKEQSSRYSNWRKKMAQLRKQFEYEIEKLEMILKLNKQEQKDIKSLRDQLFNGTSVLESREGVSQAQITVKQGYNIRLLTLVSIFFLPLTFVTSVFGMTNMNPKDTFRPFGVVTVVICLPTYLLIGMVNSPHRARQTFTSMGWLLVRLLTCFRPDSTWRKRFLDRYPGADGDISKHAGGLRLRRSFSAFERDLSSTTRRKTRPITNNIRRPVPPNPSQPQPIYLPRRETGNSIRFEAPDIRPDKLPVSSPAKGSSPATTTTDDVVEKSESQNNFVSVPSQPIRPLARSFADRSGSLFRFRSLTDRSRPKSIVGATESLV